MKRYLLLSLCLICLLPVSAVAAGLNEVIATLETPFSSGTEGAGAIHDFSADFSQESRLVSLDRMQRGRGEVKVRFEKEKGFGDRVPLVKFRWKYEQPTNQEIVSDGETMWVYLPENNQVIQTNIEQTGMAQAEDPMTFLTGLGNLSRDFTIRWAVPDTDAEGNPVLQLRPRRVSNLIREMQIVVDRFAVQDYQSGQGGRRLPMLSTHVTDPQGNTTIIEFSDAEVNFGVSDFDFRFILPAGVDVVRPTGREMGF